MGDAFVEVSSLSMKKKEAKILRNVAVLFLPATVESDAWSVARLSPSHLQLVPRANEGEERELTDKVLAKQSGDLPRDCSPVGRVPSSRSHPRRFCLACAHNSLNQWQLRETGDEGRSA
jgi:hypothetical protein